MIDGLFLRISDKDKMYGHIYFSFVVYDLLAFASLSTGVAIDICFVLDLTDSLLVCVSYV